MEIIESILDLVAHMDWEWLLTLAIVAKRTT